MKRITGNSSRAFTLYVHITAVCSAVLLLASCVPHNPPDTVPAEDRSMTGKTAEARSSGDKPRDGKEPDRSMTVETTGNYELEVAPEQVQETGKDPGVADYKAAKAGKGVTVVAKPDTPVLRQRGEAAVKEQNRFYDKSNEAYELLQKANESMAGFPVNRVGEVDWMKALDQGLIDPRSTRTGSREREMRNDVIILDNTKEMPNVRFPHDTHTYWLDCKNCHDSIFIPEAGANDMNMYRIFNGEYCGVCHNKVAFTTYICESCHVED